MPSRSIDPLSRRLLRLARVALSTHLAEEIASGQLRDVPPLVIEHGLNASVLHALHARMHPERAAIVDERRTLTYALVDIEINRLANALRVRAGLGRGDTLAIAIENRAEYLVTWFAAMRLGVRVLHAGAHVTAEELAHVVRTGGGRVVLVVSEGTVEAARQVRTGLSAETLHLVTCAPVLPAEGELAYESLVASGDATFPSLRHARGESVVFTSGTTGKPKGAVRDFAAFGPTELTRVLDRLPFAFGDRHMVVGPLHHSAPQVFALIHTALAGTLHLAPRFDAEATLRRLSERRIHSTFVVPTMLRRILDLPPSVHAQTPTPDLRAIVVGSSEFPEEMRRAAIARFGARKVFDFYGATELGWVTLIRGDEMLRKPGSVGRPLVGQQIRILDEQGRESAPGQTGIIAVRNEQTMVGYAHDPGATRDAQRGEWWTVDDLGRVDRDGYLYLSGRARDMVKSGGVNVYPAEVEIALRSDPTVLDVAVIGLPDREWGERLVAVVVPRDAAFDPAQAKARARERLSAAKVPREWHVVDALPRNANGKVLKNELRARFRPSDTSVASPP